MAGATAGDDGDLGSGIGRRTAVDDFVVYIEGNGGVCESEAMEGRSDKVGRVVDEVFGRHGYDL